METSAQNSSGRGSEKDQKPTAMDASIAKVSMAARSRRVNAMQLIVLRALLVQGERFRSGEGIGRHRHQRRARQRRTRRAEELGGRHGSGRGGGGRGRSRGLLQPE